MKELELRDEIKKVDDNTFVFEHVFRSELTKDECLKFKTGAEKNIKRIYEELEKHTEEHIQNTLKEFNDAIDLEVGLKKEALKDFPSYIKKTIAEFEKRTQEKRKEFQEFLNNVDKIRAEVEVNVRKEVNNEKQALLSQLEDEKKVVEIYKEVTE